MTYYQNSKDPVLEKMNDVLKWIEIGLDKNDYSFKDSRTAKIEELAKERLGACLGPVLCLGLFRAYYHCHTRQATVAMPPFLG